MDRAPAAVASGVPRVWTTVTPTLLGDATSTWTIDGAGLSCTTDDPFERSVAFRWCDVREAASATMDMKPGGPDRPSWAASRLDWLVASLADGTTVTRRLPAGSARDEIVTAVAAALGTRWSGDAVPFADTQRRLGGAGATAAHAWLQLALVVVGFFVLAIVATVALAMLLTPVATIPAATVAGLWLLRHARACAGAAAAAGELPVVPIGAAVDGVVRIAGRVAPFGTHAAPTIAAVSGTPAIWWDATVHVIGRENNVDDARQVAGRFGGTIDTVVVTDASGAIPVWLDGADLVIARRTWESEKQDALPAGGQALLAELGFAWTAERRIRIVEESVDVGTVLTIVGTRTARASLPATDRGALSRWRRLVVTGEWRRAIVAALPPILRPMFAVFIGYLDLVGRFGFARQRPPIRLETPPPALDPSASLVWRGAPGHPFVVSNRPLDATCTLLRQRALLYRCVGIALLVFALYQAGAALLVR